MIVVFPLYILGSRILPVLAIYFDVRYITVSNLLFQFENWFIQYNMGLENDFPNVGLCIKNNTLQGQFIQTRGNIHFNLNLLEF